ncbi:hypothetical protein [Hyphomicrobium sp. ghe19]|uniref:hypothetical protein n=1 Tax=Hyphomicrobium sp. ghe19 TaxID=2682968 RepID=UPI00136795B6|nr:hypothetical protein HYPP_02608 [Hyphomicrobium sp. ghe19]
MKILMVTLAAFILAGCDEPKDFIVASPADRGPYEVKFLLEHDGCKVFRFRDYEYRYFVRCDGASSSGASWSETHRAGKTSHTEHYSIPTEEKN